MEDKLTKSFKASINQKVANVVVPLVDTAILELNNNIKIPFVSTIVNLFQLGKSIKDRFTYNKLVEFVNGVKEQRLTEEEIDKHIDNFSGNVENELEYIIIMIDRESETEQVNMLAKLYVSFIRNKINWKEFRQYANIVERLLPGDLEELFDFHGIESLELETRNINSSVLRLQGLGLITTYLKDDEVIDENVIFATSNEAYYKETVFANKFIECIKD